MWSGDDRQVNIWEVGATLLWLIGGTLVVLDWRLPPDLKLTGVGMALLIAANAVTTRCIARRHLEASCRQMKSAFQLGRDYGEAISPLSRRREPPARP